MKLLECPKLEAVNHLLSIRTGDCIIDGRLQLLHLCTVLKRAQIYLHRAQTYYNFVLILHELTDFQLLRLAQENLHEIVFFYHTYLIAITRRHVSVGSYHMRLYQMQLA